MRLSADCCRFHRCRAAQLLAPADAVRCAMAHTLGQLRLYLAAGVVAPALEALQGELRSAATLEQVGLVCHM